MSLAKCLGDAALAATVTIGLGGAAWAQQDQATPEEVVEKVQQAARHLAEQGEAGLATFRTRNSEYVWKDTYVFVANCDEGTMAAHPIQPALEGRSLAEVPAYGDKSPEEMQAEMCRAEPPPQGWWVEYMWPKPGEQEPVRKISFDMAVKGTPYIVGAGVYDEDTTIKELERISGDAR